MGIAAAETKSPRRNIAKSCNRVFYKVLTLYLLSILTVGWTVPSYDPRLLAEKGDASQSPFVIAMVIAGIKGLPHFVNALFFSSAFSAGNAYLYSASRILYGECHNGTIQFGLSDASQGLSLRGQAPLVFSRCTASGLPLVSVFFCVGRLDQCAEPPYNENPPVLFRTVSIYESQRHIGSRVQLAREPGHGRRVLSLVCDQHILHCILYVSFYPASSQSDS